MITPATLLASLKPGHPGRAAIMATCADTAEGKPVKRRGKYNAKRTQAGGIWFDSAGEAAGYERIVLMHQAGEVKWYALQPRFILPGPYEYRADYLVVMRDGTVRVIDFKGMDTKLSRLKRKQVKSIYGLEVELWK